ncbi:MAG TPA: hypothetical protein VGJ80_06290 [Gemmatimonadales bacterium]|jgi:hypothetical protein
MARISTNVSDTVAARCLVEGRSLAAQTRVVMEVWARSAEVRVVVEAYRQTHASHDEATRKEEA